ncbi:MAG: peptide deformylase [Chloroflexi bacterium]|nr:peptide deformylase [Chloroflexota bacterium]
MSVRTIVTVPNDVLRRKARPVTKFDDKLKTLIDDMIETMREAPGVGLAAPQVAVPERVIVVEFGDEEDEEVPPKLYVMVNPEVTRSSNDTEIGVEGCLSVPGLVGEVERSVSVTIKGKNRHGQPMRLKAKGWLARIFLHEIDHLDGILFTDLATSIWQPEEPIEDRV